LLARADDLVNVGLVVHADAVLRGHSIVLRFRYGAAARSVEANTLRTGHRGQPDRSTGEGDALRCANAKAVGGDGSVTRAPTKHGDTIAEMLLDYGTPAARY
jgi:hypothetical protein